MRYYELKEDYKSRFGNRYNIVHGQSSIPTTFRTARNKIEVHPTDSEVASKFTPRPGRYPDRSAYYDPELSDLVDVDDDDPIMHLRYAKPKGKFSIEIEPLPEANIMYRGMSFEEYETFLKQGYIKSLGEYNFENQKGLTYWAAKPEMAISYANSFAPMNFKPTFTKPAFVVAAHRPKHTIHVPGTGADEIGVPIAIPKEEIVAVWKGKVYEFMPGEFSLFRHHPDYPGFESDDPTHPEKLNGGVSPSASVVWERIK